MPDDACGADKLLEQYRGITLPQCDPLLTLRLDRDLAAVRNQMAQQVEAEGELARRKESAVATLLEQAAAAQAVEQDGTQFTEQSKRTSAEAEEARAREASLRVWVDRLTRVIEDVEAWAEPRLRTLMWRVGESVGGALERATLDQQDALAGTGEIPEFDVESVDVARKRVSKMLVFWLVGSVLLSIVGLVWLNLLLAPVVGVLILAGGTLASFSKYSRVKSEAEWRYASARQTSSTTSTGCRTRQREVSRLSTIYELYIEWAESSDSKRTAHGSWTKRHSTARPPSTSIGMPSRQHWWSAQARSTTTPSVRSDRRRPATCNGRAG